MEKQKLIIIKSYSQPTEAHLDKSKLESHGIQCFIQDEFTVSMNWLYSNAIGGVKLQVYEDELEKAIEILEEKMEEIDDIFIESDQNETYVDNITPKQAFCPKCNSDNIHKEMFSKAHACLWLLALPFIFFSKKWKCFDCNYEWQKV